MHECPFLRLHSMSAGGLYNCINTKIIGSKSYLHTFEADVECELTCKSECDFFPWRIRFENISRWYVINRMCLIFNVHFVKWLCADLISALWCCFEGSRKNCCRSTMANSHQVKRVNGWVKKHPSHAFPIPIKLFSLELLVIKFQ